jgi:hypothetical protein
MIFWGSLSANPHSEVSKYELAHRYFATLPHAPELSMLVGGAERALNMLSMKIRFPNLDLGYESNDT